MLMSSACTNQNRCRRDVWHLLLLLMMLLLSNDNAYGGTRRLRHWRNGRLLAMQRFDDRRMMRLRMMLRQI